MNRPKTAAATDDRRRVERTDAADTSIAFTYQKQNFTGKVTNSTENGVAIRLDPTEHHLYLVTGTLLDIQVGQTFLSGANAADQNGRQECLPHDTHDLRRCRVVWARIQAGEFQLGVEFLDGARDPQSKPSLNLDHVKIDPALALRIPPSLAMRRQMLPFAMYDGIVHVACGSTPDATAIQAVERMVQAPARAEIAEIESLKRALNRVYGNPQAASFSNGAQLRSRSVDLRNLNELEADDAVGLCEELLHSAVLRQASDIHIDPEEAGLKIRFRVDGVLEQYRMLPKAVQPGIISRFKVMSGMDIAEKRAAQDGGFKHVYSSNGQSVDLRVATLPTKHGERMTLRLLALETESLTLERLGMSQRDQACFEDSIDKPHGMILLTGPTGSGKSTTLYAAIRRLIQREPLNVVTIEDPIEYDIPGVAQVEVDAADKVTFGKALRSVLRHDPDVVMIGEIRDVETAGIAIKAALTGHLVFSTLHTNTAPGVITRLADMGVERYLVGACLRLAVAQRLVRRLCPHCRESHGMTETEARTVWRPDLVGEEIWMPKGCMYCGGRGYQGRVALFEMLPLDEHLSRRVAEGAEEPELIAYMRQHRRALLMDDAVGKLRAGVTSLPEILSAVTIW